MTLPLLPIDLTPLRAVVGDLPPDGCTEVAGVTVPPGRRLPLPGGGEPAFWVTTEHLSQPRAVVAQLQAAFPRTGLWPLLTFGPDTAGYPWGEGSEDWRYRGDAPTWDAESERDGWRYSVDTSTWDTETVWRHRWRNAFEDIDREDDDDDLDEDGSENPWEFLRPWPGLTTPATPGGPAEVEDLGGDSMWLEPGQLVLVPVPRPEDALLVIGGSGYNSRPGPVESTVVLRSWGDRYGAVPVRFSHDRLEVALRRPPRTSIECLAAATEQMCFSADSVLSFNTLADVDSLSGATGWYFWWD